MSCAVPTCLNRFKGHVKQVIKFHRFPRKDIQLRNVWLERIGNPKINETNFRRYLICHDHFHDMCKNYSKKGLLDFSTPTLLLPNFRGDPNEYKNCFLLGEPENKENNIEMVNTIRATDSSSSALDLENAEDQLSVNSSNTLEITPSDLEDNPSLIESLINSTEVPCEIINTSTKSDMDQEIENSDINVISCDDLQDKLDDSTDNAIILIVTSSDKETVCESMEPLMNDMCKSTVKKITLLKKSETGNSLKSTSIKINNSNGNCVTTNFKTLSKPINNKLRDNGTNEEIIQPTKRQKKFDSSVESINSDSDDNTTDCSDTDELTIFSRFLRNELKKIKNEQRLEKVKRKLLHYVFKYQDEENMEN